MGKTVEVVDMVVRKNGKSKSKNQSFNFFIDRCKEIFKFLIDDYSMEVLEPEIYGFECSVTFRRYQELAVTIMYEAGTMPWVLFTAVTEVDGVLRNERFALDYVIEERLPKFQIDKYEFGEQNEEKMKNVLLQYAKIIKECCNDILEGDFSILPKIRERRESDQKKLNEE